MTIKLELGKRYKTREGDYVTGPLEPNSDGTKTRYPFEGVVPNCYGRGTEFVSTWTSDGKYLERSDKQHSLDLVSEYVEPASADGNQDTSQGHEPGIGNPLTDFRELLEGIDKALSDDDEQGDLRLASGLTLRDHLALSYDRETVNLAAEYKLAFMGIDRSTFNAMSKKEAVQVNFDFDAKARYAWADAMLAARSRKGDA